MIHDKAEIHPSAKLGKNITVWAFANILAECVIGDNVSIGAGAEIGRGTVIGKNSRISAHVFLPSNSVIGENVFIGPNATFTDDRMPRAGNDNYIAEPPVLRDGCSVGAGAVVLPGVMIGERAMVGAGAVVTRNVAPNGLVRGEPAREKAYESLMPLRFLRQEIEPYV